jgi:uncharacterized repeat protein (TIGR02543 family)
VPPATYIVTFAPGDHGAFAVQVTLGLTAGDATPVAPTPNAASGWRFVGWSPVIAATVTGDTTYTAQWERITHTVSYAPGAYGSGIMPSVTVNAGDTYSVIQSTFTPQSGYTFVGWEATGTTTGSLSPGNVFIVTGDVVLTARWDSVQTPPTTPQVFTVTFIDFDGTLITTQVVTEGGSATPPPTPARTGFSFVGWDTTLSNVSSNLVARAIYTNQLPTSFTVTFDPGTHGAFGPQITKGLVVGDITPQAPQPDAGTGWRFVGWSPVPTSTVTGDVTYIAQWESTTPVEVPTPPDTSTTQPTTPTSPTVTINNPSTTPAPAPDTYVTVPGSSSDTTQNSTSSTNTSTTTPTNTGDSDSQAQTTLPDSQIPQTSTNTDAADEPAGSNLLLLLIALLFLALMVVVGWLLLRKARY